MMSFQIGIRRSTTKKIPIMSSGLFWERKRSAILTGITGIPGQQIFLKDGSQRRLSSGPNFLLFILPPLNMNRQIIWRQELDGDL